ncbi:hypothetical protein ACFQ69_36435 [Streptomyces sp. NPDC056470]|uniref:helix-turn-helix domain-containing protein n=1 Tax=Streptomyces sp. NPDC056470 TaxID=3345831 RepID=UPI003679FF8A
MGWKASTDSLVARGLRQRGGQPTTEGRAMRTHIEARTDDLAVRAYRTFTHAEAARCLDVLTLLATEVFDSDTIPFPNPMGLPARRR